MHPEKCALDVAAAPAQDWFVKRSSGRIDMGAQQAYRHSDLDVMPVLKMYIDSLEAWKKNCDEFTGRVSNMQNNFQTNGSNNACESGLPAWQRSGEEFFKRFVEQQMEICRFLSARWEQYLKLPGQLALCRTPADVGQVQAAFLSQFVDDYTHETKKLAQPAGQMMSSWTAGHQA